MKRLNKWVLCLFLIIGAIANPLPQAVFAASTESCSAQDIHSVAHRGYSQAAPENTLIAYRQAKEKGFTYVECDVAFTADGIAVLLHDDTIDRTSDGTGKLSELTYEQLLQFDFGSWKSTEYTGTKIPTFEEFIALCAELELHPYIELKNRDNCTSNNIRKLVEIVYTYGMAEETTWISFSITLLRYVKNVAPTARLGYITSSDVAEYMLCLAKTLRTGTNEVFLNLPYQNLTDSGVLCSIKHGFPIEVYTVNSESDLFALPTYVSGVTSDYLHAQTILTGADSITISETVTYTVENSINQKATP